MFTSITTYSTSFGHVLWVDRGLINVWFSVGLRHCCLPKGHPGDFSLGLGTGCVRRTTSTVPVQLGDRLGWGPQVSQAVHVWFGAALHLYWASNALTLRGITVQGHAWAERLPSMLFLLLSKRTLSSPRKAEEERRAGCPPPDGSLSPAQALGAAGGAPGRRRPSWGERAAGPHRPCPALRRPRGPSLEPAAAAWLRRGRPAAGSARGPARGRGCCCCSSGWRCPGRPRAAGRRRQQVLPVPFPAPGQGGCSQAGGCSAHPFGSGDSLRSRCPSAPAAAQHGAARLTGRGRSPRRQLQRSRGSRGLRRSAVCPCSPSQFGSRRTAPRRGRGQGAGKRPGHGARARTKGPRRTEGGRVPPAPAAGPGAAPGCATPSGFLRSSGQNRFFINIFEGRQTSKGCVQL